MKTKFLLALLALSQYFVCTAETHSIFNDLNIYRMQHGLHVLEEQTTLCALAEKRVQQIQTDWSHLQFQPEIDTITNMNGEFYENLARTLKPEQVVWGWSMSQMGHREAMLVPTMKYGCVAELGNHYVFEGYVPNENEDLAEK